MKKYFYSISLLMLLLASCGISENSSNTSSSLDNSSTSENPSSSESSTSEEGVTSTTVSSSDTTSTTSEGEIEEKTNSMQDLPILHTWNWSISNISSRLTDIKEAGYKAIQLSPLQPQKDYYTNQNWSSQWWKLYQPLGFKVATSNENVMGTKSELTALCTKANNMGIKVIMDVVSNHLAGGNKTSLNSAVKNYESEIYNKNLIHNLNTWADDNNVESIVRGNIGDYPDLMTESEVVQNRVISLLKEYVDCGVDGFRFDAAKHIETADDGEYASSYWDNVLTTTTQYALAKGEVEPYYYGEILTTCGVNRSYSSYTKYMSTIDNKQGTKILNAVVNKSTSSLNATYNSKVSPSKLVLWAESHDTYANDSKETTNVSLENIHKAYMIQASRKDASALYFARPGNASFGEVGTEDYKDAEIKAINNFHMRYVDKSESISSNNGVFINVRGTGLEAGALLVNIANTSSSNIKVNVNGLANGTYLDLISNKEFSVNNNEIVASFTANALVLVPKDVSDNKSPSLSISTNEEVFKDTATISVTANNATTLAYSVDDGTATSFSGSSFTLPTSLDSGLHIIKVTASNSYGSVTKELDLIKTTTLYDKDLIIYNVDTAYTYFAWLWADGDDGSWYEFSNDNDLMGLDMGENNNFIVVKFTKGTSKADWNNKIAQTANMSFEQRIYNFNELGL